MAEGKKTTSYVCEISEAQAAQLRELLTSRGWVLREQQYARFKAVGERINVVAYQSGKLTVQGAGTADFVEFILEPEILHTFTFGLPEEPAAPPDISPHIGVDESGKGDFFGPLVVAGVYIDERTGPKLAELGVRDSKTVKSDQQIFKLAEGIRQIAAGQYTLVTLKPSIYNSLYERIGNLNRLLAWGHARTIETLLEMIPGCPRALSDKFADDSLILRALQQRGRQIVMEQRTRAESDIAVAAASILARAKFVSVMRELEQEAGVSLPKGAGAPVKETARKIFAAGGREALMQCAKTHFKTYQEITGSAG